MISGKKKVQITKDKILEHCDEIDIVQAFYPANKKLEFNKGISSPFRSDPSPSFIIGTKYGNISYKDLGDETYRGDVWKFVQQMEGLSFNDALIKIDQKLQLGLTNGKPIIGKVITAFEKPKIEWKPPPLIQVISRKPNKQELNYWSEYFQGLDDLKRENVYFPKTIYRNKQKIPLLDMTFCYFYPDIEKWKIYRPFAPKKGKNLMVHEWKWDTNLPFTYLENEKDLIPGNIFLTKSKKDRMVLMNILETNNIFSVQAEDSACLSPEFLDDIDKIANMKIAVTDNDAKGKQFSWWLTTQKGFKHCNVPDVYNRLGITDFADLGKAYGREKVRNHFKKKGYI
jgi:hypothetical protein